MRLTADPDPEFTVLTTPAGRALLAEVAAVPRPGPADLARWRKQAPANEVAAAARIADGRRRARDKFAHADRIWPEAVAVEQATATLVARHKAARFAGMPGQIVVDLCCGIGGDAVALAGAGLTVLVVDRDRGMVRRAVWNAGVHDVGDRVQGVQSLAEGFTIPPEARVHIDPDRRASGKNRAMRVGDYAPGLAFLRSLSGRCRGGAIKLGPASDFAELNLPGPVEVELVSLGGECKEATVWFGDLARSEVRTRATCLPAGATWTDRDADPAAHRAPVAAIGPWVFDPDPALVRAGLLDGFAAAMGLARVGPGVNLLTGPDPVHSPWLAGFAVAAVLPLDRKTLRREVATRGLGPLEIKTRGVDHRPEALRAELRPPGPHPATLILVGGPGMTARAIIATREASPVSGA